MEETKHRQAGTKEQKYGVNGWRRNNTTIPSSPGARIPYLEGCPMARATEWPATLATHWARPTATPTLRRRNRQVGGRRAAQRWVGRRAGAERVG